MKTIRFGFDAGGFALFLLIMIPNFVWFAVPTASDVLRQESVTPILDAAASVIQVLMVAALCVLVCGDAPKLTSRSRWLWASAAALLLYYVGWILYYAGIAAPVVLLVLSVFPCVALIAYAIDRKNGVAVVPGMAFMLLHVASTVINFMV